MQNINVKIDLAKAGRLISIKGEEYVAIPLSKKSIYKGKKSIPWSLIAIARKEVAEDGQTHFIKEVLPAEDYNALTPEERRSQPIIGSMSECKPRNEQPVAEPVEVDETTDMPF